MPDIPLNYNMAFYKNIFLCGCFILLFSFVKCSFNLQCRDENNREVDWFINYKIPTLNESFPGSYINEGTAYTYITSSKPGYWKLSPESIASDSSMLGYTVQNFLNVRKNVSYLAYNDEPPAGFNGTASGHLKGIVAFDGKHGFWLVHSIPKFSNLYKYEYPNNAKMFGQSVLCISLRTSALNDICKQLLLSHPKIYDYGLTDEVNAFLDDKTRSLFTDEPEFMKKMPLKNTVILKSLDREIFLSFAKDNLLHKDLYSDIVATSLGTSLATETWRRGRGTLLPPFCGSKYSVLDVTSINMNVSNTNIFFNSYDDHSKWAISTDSAQHWICIGDINRMLSQEKRGGGTVCFQSRAVWNAYFSIINETDKCPV